MLSIVTLIFSADSTGTAVESPGGPEFPGGPDGPVGPSGPAGPVSPLQANMKAEAKSTNASFEMRLKVQFIVVPSKLGVIPEYLESKALYLTFRGRNENGSIQGDISTQNAYVSYRDNYLLPSGKSQATAVA